MTLEPGALMLATESDLVCTRSPGKTAEDFGTLLPFSQAVPLVYSMAAPESAANKDAGTSTIKKQATTVRRIRMVVIGLSRVTCFRCLRMLAPNPLTVNPRCSGNDKALCLRGSKPTVHDFPPEHSHPLV